MLVDAAMLREFKIFDELNDRELETIALAAKWEELGPGARLSEAGAPAKHLYLIVEGRLDVNVVGPHGKSIGADQIGPGQVFGWGAESRPVYLYCFGSDRREDQVHRVQRQQATRDLRGQQPYRLPSAEGHGAVISRRISMLENKVVEGLCQRTARTREVLRFLRGSGGSENRSSGL